MEVVPKVLFEVQVVVQRVDLPVLHRVFVRPAATLVAAQARFVRPAADLVAAQVPFVRPAADLVAAQVRFVRPAADLVAAQVRFVRPAADLVAAQVRLKVPLGQNRVHLNLLGVLRLVVHQEGGHDEKTISTEP